MSSVAVEIKGDVEEIAQNAQLIKNYGQELESTLATLKSVVDNISGGTYGVSAGTLTDVYYALDTELNEYVDTLDTLGANVNTSSENLSNIDTAASRGLSYDG